MTQRLTVKLRRLQRDSHDKCSACGRPFLEGDTAHAGYSANDQELYVGNCCRTLLVETAARHYWQPMPDEVPPGASTLWRYMDFAKFAALIKDKAVHFARADQLGDPWEAAKGSALNKQRWDEHYLQFFRDSVRNPPPGYRCELSDDEVEKEARRLLHELAEIGELDRRTFYVSCWHESEVESEALWRLYCPPPSSGIAIRTTASALNASLGDDPEIEIARVSYVDFRSGFAGVNDAIFRKRRSLSHEKEVRAVIRLHAESPEQGMNRPANLSLLLKAIVVSPFAPSWFEATLREVMTRFGVNAPP